MDNELMYQEPDKIDPDDEYAYDYNGFQDKTVDG